MKLIYNILCVLAMAMLLAGCSSNGEINGNSQGQQPVVSPDSGAYNSTDNEQVMPKSGSEQLQEPSLASDAPTDSKLNITFEEICGMIEELPEISTQAPNQVYETCEKTSSSLSSYFRHNEGYEGKDFSVFSYPNGYYLKFHPVTTEYADAFRIIEFGNEKKEMGLSECVFVQSFYGIWENNNWVPYITCQQIATLNTSTLSSEELLSANFYGSWFSTNLILMTSTQNWGEHPSSEVAVAVFNVESHWQDLQSWEPTQHHFPQENTENWQFAKSESGNGYTIRCDQHRAESSLQSLLYEDALSGRGFKLTCPHDKSHNVTMLPSIEGSYLVSINNVDVTLTLLPSEFVKHRSIDEENEDYIVDEVGCGWWCLATRDVIITSDASNSPIDHSVFDSMRDTFWLSNGNGIGEWVNFKSIYADSSYNGDLWVLPPEPGPEFGIYTIGIVNGNATNENEWHEYSRAKTINVLLDGTLIYRLRLADTIDRQFFSLPFPIGFKYNIPFDITFEIEDVYPGKSEEVAISDITLEPVIPH